LDQAVKEMEDEDGWGVVGMAIQGSCGHREREAVVRAVVGRWGLDAGPRQGRDKGASQDTIRLIIKADLQANWTPLHIAAIISTPPLISFLLTRGASTSAVTDRGLTPFDLVAGMPNREEISLLLDNTGGDDHPTKSPDHDETNIDTERTEALRKHRARATYRMEREKDKERKMRREEEREQWIREQSAITSVEAELLLPPKRHHGRRSADSGLAWATSDDEEDESASEDEEDLSQSVSYSQFQWRVADIQQMHGAFDDMLVFAPWNVTTLLDILVTRYRPHAQPAERRGLPANALHRYARFALAHWDEDCLEMFIGRALERIEHEIYVSSLSSSFGGADLKEHDKDLARQAFWAYNTTLLLHLLNCDPALSKAECMPELMRMIEEMISAIHGTSRP
jgi:hypothetical protein